jgi:hypothetical protein
MKYTHVSRINVAAKDSVAKEWKVVETPDVWIPTTIDELQGMLSDPAWQKPVTVVLNEQSELHKQKLLGVPLICKLVIDSIKLITNGKATSRVRQGDGGNLSAVFLTIPADAEFTTKWREKFKLAAVAGKDAQRKLAEEYLASQEASDGE